MAVAEAYHAYEQGSQISPLSAAAVSNQTIQESQRLLLLVRAYQVCKVNFCSCYLPLRIFPLHACTFCFMQLVRKYTAEAAGCACR